MKTIYKKNRISHFTSISEYFYDTLIENEVNEQSICLISTLGSFFSSAFGDAIPKERFLVSAKDVTPIEFETRF